MTERSTTATPPGFVPDPRFIGADFGVSHFGGVPFDETDPPPWGHACRTQTICWGPDWFTYDRCSCGGIRPGGEGSWIRVNQRRLDRGETPLPVPPALRQVFLSRRPVRIAFAAILGLIVSVGIVADLNLPPIAGWPLIWCTVWAFMATASTLRNRNWR